MKPNYYETDRALSEYLLFHYGSPKEVLPAGLDALNVGNFPARCVSECCDTHRLPRPARALDLGCAVGRSSFELARSCEEVIGVDFSERFVAVCEHLRKNGSILFGCIDEGELTHPCQAVVPTEIDRNRVRFQRGDAMDLPESLGSFDFVLMANLIDRLSEPRRCLARLPRLVKPGGQLVITSPYTWLPEYTARENWLGGFEKDAHRVRAVDTLKEILAADFQFVAGKDLPFLIREHARKFQLGIAEGTIWRRK